MNQIIRMRESLYIFITCIIAIIFLSLMLKPNFAPKGIYLPNPDANLSSSLSKITPDSVKIAQYLPNTKPAGTINILKHFEFITLEANQKNILAINKEAKKIAARHNCNLLYRVSVQQSPFSGPLDEIKAKFYAYKI